MEYPSKTASFFFKESPLTKICWGQSLSSFEVQRESLQQSSDLENRFLQELGLVRQDVEDRIRGSTEQLSNALGQLENYTLRGNEGITTTLCLS